jgi:hypothetical protein
LGSLQVVAGADGLFAVVVFGFVGVEVYLSQESTSVSQVIRILKGVWKRTFSRDVLIVEPF